MLAGLCSRGETHHYWGRKKPMLKDITGWGAGTKFTKLKWIKSEVGRKKGEVLVQVTEKVLQA